jgi:hypothetical protein
MTPAACVDAAGALLPPAAMIELIFPRVRYAAEKCQFAPSVATAEGIVMTSRALVSFDTAKYQLRSRIISNYRRAQRAITVTAASSAANPRSAIAAYDKASERLRFDILRASKLFPDTDALLTWLLTDIADDVVPEQDRINFALTVRTMKEEAGKNQRAS